MAVMKYVAYDAKRILTLTEIRETHVPTKERWIIVHYLVVYVSGPSWVAGRLRREQPGWADHAEFMNALEEQGIALLGGPLDDSETVLVVMRASEEADLRTRLSTDPWLTHAILRLQAIHSWDVLLGGSGTGAPVNQSGQYFVAIRMRGPAWEPDPVSAVRDSEIWNPLAATMRAQPQWAEHSRFMAQLADEGFVVFGGPVAHTDKVVHVVRAESEAAVHARLAQDPWTSAGLLHTDALYRWDILLGAE